MNSRLTLILLTAGAEFESELQAVLATDARVRVLAVSENPEKVYAETIRWQPSAVIITMGSDPRAAWNLSRRIHSASPGTMIICAARQPSSEMILESLRAGACEFLRLPIIADELSIVLERIELFSAGVEVFSAGKEKSPKKLGRVIAVYASKGGCGASFIAANLAATVVAPTVLVDLNLRAGDQDIFWGVKPKYSIYDLVANRSRMDDSLLTSFVTPLTSNLALLAAPPEVASPHDFRTEHVQEMIELLRERYAYIIFDLAHNLDAPIIAALDQADEILLVFTLDLLAARGAKRALTIFKQLGYPHKKIKLVANRYAKKVGIQVDKVEQFLGEKIACYVSNDYPHVIDSINQGQPIVRLVPGSPLTSNMRELAGVCGITFTGNEGTERRGKLATFFRRQTPNSVIDASAIPDKA